MITSLSKRKAGSEAAFRSSFTLCCSTSKCSFRYKQQIRCYRTFSLFIAALGRSNENWTSPAGTSKNLWSKEKPLKEFCCCWGFEVLLSPQWTGDLGMGTSHIPNLKGFSLFCFSQHFLWNLVIPVNGFQFLGADTSHQRWCVGKLPTKSATGPQDSWFVVLLNGNL